MKKDDQFNKKQLDKVRAQYQKLQAAMLELKERNAKALLAFKKRGDYWQQQNEKVKAKIAEMTRKAGSL